MSQVAGGSEVSRLWGTTTPGRPPHFLQQPIDLVVESLDVAQLPTRERVQQRLLLLLLWCQQQLPDQDCLRRVLPQQLRTT